MKPINIHIEIPVEVTTPMLTLTRKNSLFYAGKDIARVNHGKTEYILTTAGEYVFTYKSKNYSMNMFDDTKSTISDLSELTDTKIRKMDERGDIENWGWFGINVWIDGKCQDYPMGVYSTYDEALSSFCSYVKNDITKGVYNHG